MGSTFFTGNLKRKLQDHNNGQSKSIKPRVPFRLIYYEAYQDKKVH